MDIDKIGIIVDGPTEEGALKKMFLKQFFKSPLIRFGPGNGENYSVQMFAKRVVPTVIFMLNRCVYSVILIPDLEKRARKGKTTLERFSYDIKKAVIEETIKKSSLKKDNLEEVLFVCPSDIMFENWIISDIEGIKNSNRIIAEAKQDFYDGKNGANVLNRIMISNYKKTVDAQFLFKYVNTQIGITNSPSFCKFITTLNKLLSL